MSVTTLLSERLRNSVPAPLSTLHRPRDPPLGMRDRTEGLRQAQEVIRDHTPFRLHSTINVSWSHSCLTHTSKSIFNPAKFSFSNLSETLRVVTRQLVELEQFLPDVRMGPGWSDTCLAQALTLKTNGRGLHEQDPDGYELQQKTVIVATADADKFAFPARFRAVGIEVAVADGRDRTVPVVVNGDLVEALDADGQMVGIYRINKI